MQEKINKSFFDALPVLPVTITISEYLPTHVQHLVATPTDRDLTHKYV